MDFQKFKSHYQKVRDISFKVFETDISPIRCHEMAYLICAGMVQKGYHSSVEDGIYERRMEHSWVRIKDGGLWLLNRDALINFQFNSWSWLYDKPIWCDDIVIDYKRKRQFKKAKIDYQLADGIKQLSEQLFSRVVE